MTQESKKRKFEESDLEITPTPPEKKQRVESKEKIDKLLDVVSRGEDYGLDDPFGRPSYFPKGKKPKKPSRDEFLNSQKELAQLIASGLISDQDTIEIIQRVLDNQFFKYHLVRETKWINSAPFSLLSAIITEIFLPIIKSSPPNTSTRNDFEQNLAILIIYAMLDDDAITFAEKQILTEYLPFITETFSWYLDTDSIKNYKWVKILPKYLLNWSPKDRDLLFKSITTGPGAYRLNLELFEPIRKSTKNQIIY